MLLEAPDADKQSDRWRRGNSATSDRDYARLALEIAAEGHRDAAIGASIAASDRDLHRWFTRSSRRRRRGAYA